MTCNASKPALSRQLTFVVDTTPAGCFFAKHVQEQDQEEEQ